MLIFGSCAAKHWFPDFRIPNDFETISPGNQYWIDSFHYLEINNSDPQYVDANFLYTIKVSHAAWNIHWDKTMLDIKFFQNKNCILDMTFFDLLYKDWELLHGKKKVNMNVQNDNFFTSKITRTIAHDKLHEIVKFYDKPLHESIRKDLNSPLCSKELFYNLSKDDRIKCMLEEIHVFILERYSHVKSVNHAKYKALKQLITSSTSGWFNLELILNFQNLMNFDSSTIIQNSKNFLINKR